MFKKLGIKSRNIPIVLIAEITGGMLFFLPILALYYEQSLFSVTNVTLIFAVESICVVLFEVPTGAIADLFGRKVAIVMAQVFVLIGLAFLAIGGSLPMFLLYAVFNAVGYSLASGTYSAFVYDTLKDEQKEQYFKKVFGTILAFWPLGASIGSIIGGYLASISLVIPVYATFIPIFITFILTLFLKEPKNEQEEDKNIAKQMLKTTHYVFTHKSLLLLLVALFIMRSLGGTLHFLSPLFLDFKNIPIEYFGYVGAIDFGLSSLGHYSSHALSEKLGNKISLVLLAFISPIFTLFATFFIGIYSIIFLLVPSLFFGLKNPIVEDIINNHTHSKIRATVLSVFSFSENLGLAIVSILVGYFAELYDINTAYQLCALILLVPPFLFLFLKEKKI